MKPSAKKAPDARVTEFKTGDLVSCYNNAVNWASGEIDRVGIIIAATPSAMSSTEHRHYSVQYIDEQGLQEGPRDIHNTRLMKVEL